jgi:hypothetical protein
VRLGTDKDAFRRCDEGKGGEGDAPCKADGGQGRPRTRTAAGQGGEDSKDEGRMLARPRRQTPKASALLLTCIIFKAMGSVRSPFLWSLYLPPSPRNPKKNIISIPTGNSSNGSQLMAGLGPVFLNILATMHQT